MLIVLVISESISSATHKYEWLNYKRIIAYDIVFSHFLYIDKQMRVSD